MSLVGEVFLDLLEQDAVWRTCDGRVVEVETMDPGHRANVLRLLERMAGELYRDRLVEAVESFRYQELAVVRARELEPFFSSQPERWVQDWLERQPLVRRLRTLDTTAER